MKKFICLLIVCCSVLPLAAQTSKEEVLSDLNRTGGVYYAYPDKDHVSTPAPKDYKPFYVSHYGRHGSRYLISDNDYSWVQKLMHKADNENALSSLGKDALLRLDSLWIETRGRGGDLSPLGVRQHRGIAERLYSNYPEVFHNNSNITARSTLVPRCILSMDAFCERLKELNPKLKIEREASQRNMNYLCYHSPESNAYTSSEWKEQYRKFEQAHTHPERLMASLFTDSIFVEKNVNPHDLMWGFYWIASGMQDVETSLDFYDLFTPDELFDLWQCFNYRFYACDGNFAGNKGLPVANAANLLRNIIDSAEEAVSSGASGATLRFGHDGNLIPLAAILRLDDCYQSIEDPNDFYKAFADFKIAPMAGNIQLIFFRNTKTGNVIVKFLLNEEEIGLPIPAYSAPFYNWTDVKTFLEKRYQEEATKVTLNKE